MSYEWFGKQTGNKYEMVSAFIYITVYLYKKQIDECI